MGFFEKIFKKPPEQKEKDVNYYRKPDGKIIKEVNGLGQVISPDQVPEGAEIKEWPVSEAEESKFSAESKISEQGRAREVDESGVLRVPENKKEQE